MAEQYSSATTTADSASEGRLIVGAGCGHGKKKCLKCAIKDGKGGINPPGYGTPPSKKFPGVMSTMKKAKMKKISVSKLTKKSSSKFSSLLKSNKKKSLTKMLKKFK